MSPVTVPVLPDTVAVFSQLLLDRCEAVGDAEPVIRGRRSPGDEPPFTLAREAGALRARSAPVLRPARISVSVFDLTDTAAVARLRRFEALLHGFGPAIVEVDEAAGGRIGVARVFDETGIQQPVQEPETKWWVATAAFALYMTDRAVG